MICMVCGGPITIDQTLIDHEDRWYCEACGAWGTISHATEPEGEDDDDGG